MEKIFEDKFMELQSDIISLCLELVENKVNKVYAYGVIEHPIYSFKAFFEVNGKITKMEQITNNHEILREFMKLEISDLKQMKILCDEYHQVCPSELKMIYDCDTKKYKAFFQYNTDIFGEIGFSTAYFNWRKEIEENL